MNANDDKAARPSQREVAGFINNKPKGGRISRQPRSFGFLREQMMANMPEDYLSLADRLRTESPPKNDFFTSNNP
jgi:hypothetical protein